MPFPGLFGVTLCRPVTTACPCVNMAAHKNRHILRAPVPSDAPVSVMSYTAGLLRPMSLSEYRIREQYLVIGHPANLYRHPAIMNCTLFLSTFACHMSLCTINPAENLAHLLSFQTMPPRCHRPGRCTSHPSRRRGRSSPVRRREFPIRLTSSLTDRQSPCCQG